MDFNKLMDVETLHKIIGQSPNITDSVRTKYGNQGTPSTRKKYMYKKYRQCIIVLFDIICYLPGCSAIEYSPFHGSFILHGPEYHGIKMTEPELLEHMHREIPHKIPAERAKSVQVACLDLLDEVDASGKKVPDVILYANWGHRTRGIKLENADEFDLAGSDEFDLAGSDITWGDPAEVEMPNKVKMPVKSARVTEKSTSDPKEKTPLREKVGGIEDLQRDFQDVIQ